MTNVLIIDDDRNLRETLRELFEATGYAVSLAADGNQALTTIQAAPPDLVFCDWKMPIAGGEQVLRSLASAELLTRLPVIVMTAYADGASALQAMQLGAYDFLTKPLDMDELLSLARRAIASTSAAGSRTGEPAPLEASSAHTAAPRLIGSSPAWIEVFKSIGKVARTDVGVLLLGETGTGKELVARAIHENSSRSAQPFIIVNCAAIPPDLMETELFGHERGAFTHAVAQKAGKFEAAEGGTIFLDEIGELPLALQPKLLRILQEKRFERVGGTRQLTADVRVLSATNRILEDDVEEKTFRADLFYRLNAFTLRLPPLRERRADILPLARYFLARYAHRNATPRSTLTDEASAALERYPFPGNVRELEQLIDRLAVNASGRVIPLDQLEPETCHPAQLPALDLLARLPFHESVAAWEKHLIVQALLASSGNKSDAARRLGIHRRLLYEKLQQHAIDI